MPAPAGETSSLKTSSTPGGNAAMIAFGGGPDWISCAWANAICGISAAATARPAIGSRRARFRSRREPRPRWAAPALRPDLPAEDLARQLDCRRHGRDPVKSIEDDEEDQAEIRATEHVGKQQKGQAAQA